MNKRHLNILSFFMGFFTFNFFGGGGGSSNSSVTNSSNLNNGINLSLGSFGANDGGSSFVPSASQTTRNDQKQDNGMGLSAGVAVGAGSNASGGAVAQGGNGSSASGGASALSATLFTPKNIVLGVVGFLLFKKMG